MSLERQPVQRPQGPENNRGREQGYAGFLAKQKEQLSAEFPNVGRWLETRLAALPEVRTSVTDLTGQGGWEKEMAANSEVRAITGAHFDILGQQITVTKPDGATFGWVQPGIIQKETPVTFPTPKEEITMDASGFVGLLRDPEGKVLLTVGQEPFAKTDKKALVRTPFQTSAAKLEALLAGDRQKDPNLANVLEKISNGQPIKELFASGAVDTFPLAPADPNRIEATNIGFLMQVSDPVVREELTAGGVNRWCEPEEARALARAGLMNGHTAAVLFSA